MAFSLYAAVVPSFQQILGSVSGLLEKAEAFCVEKKIPEADIVQACFAPDMLPFAFQVNSTVVHSIRAIEAVRKGVFSPDRTMPATLAALKSAVTGALTALEAVDPAEMNAFVGRDMVFSVPSRNMSLNFTAENFLLSFSQPNFYFHASTAYDILRWKGVSIGKLDYLGKMRIKA